MAAHSKEQSYYTESSSISFYKGKVIILYKQREKKGPFLMNFGQQGLISEASAAVTTVEESRCHNRMFKKFQYV